MAQPGGQAGVGEAFLLQAMSLHLISSSEYISFPFAVEVGVFQKSDQAQPPLLSLSALRLGHCPGIFLAFHLYLLLPSCCSKVSSQASCQHYY